jgi:hypothetical protein
LRVLRACTVTIAAVGANTLLVDGPWLKIVSKIICLCVRSGLTVFKLVVVMDETKDVASGGTSFVGGMNVGDDGDSELLSVVGAFLCRLALGLGVTGMCSRDWWRIFSTLRLLRSIVSASTASVQG